MTKRLEEVFNLSPNEINEPDMNEDPEQSIDQNTQLIAMMQDSMTATEKIDAALTTVSDLNKHDNEMDEIHKKAIDAFEKLLDIGLNAEAHVGSKFIESAATMLKTAMEAKDSKVDRKLRMLNLQMQKARLDHAIEKEENKGKDEGNEIEGEGKIVMDRNELMRRIANASKIDK